MLGNVHDMLGNLDEVLETVCEGNVCDVLWKVCYLLGNVGDVLGNV